MAEISFELPAEVSLLSLLLVNAVGPAGCVSGVERGEGEDGTGKGFADGTRGADMADPCKSGTQHFPSPICSKL